jgi:hypothetical protein
MTIRKGALEDSRNNFRVVAQMNCRFTHKGLSYDGVILDLSQTGAKLISLFLPPTGDKVTITIQSEHLKEALVLYGEVLRGSRVRTNHGLRGRFVVHFSQTPLDLISLLIKLLSAK